LEGRAEVVAFDKDPVSAPSLERINKVDDWPSSVGFNCRNNLVTKTGFNNWFSATASHFSKVMVLKQTKSVKAKK